LLSSNLETATADISALAIEEKMLCRTRNTKRKKQENLNR
jgi:hypothetical protein